MWPHPQQSSQRLAGPAFVYCSTLYHTPAAITPLFTSLCATFFHLTMKTTDDALVSPLCSLSLMIWGFDSHLTCTRIVTPLFSASISSLIFCSPSVPLPMYLTSGTVWIFTLSHDSFPSTSMIPLSTDLVALIMISRYRRAISAVAFWCVIAVIVPFAFLLVFMIQTCAGACFWNSALLTADAISSSICLGRGMLSSLLTISRLSAMLKPEVRARPGSGTLSSICNIRRFAVVFDPPGPMGALWLWVRGGTVSHRLGGVGADFGFCSCCCFGCPLSGSLGFGCCCSCWRFSGPPSCVVSTCCEASSPPPSISAVSSLSFSLASRAGATPFMTFTIVFVMPAPLSLLSSWQESHFCSLSCIHVLITSHCASSRPACACTKFVRCPTVRCSCVSSCACCRIVLSMRLLQSLGVAGASLLLLRFPFSSLSNGSNMVAPAVSTVVGVAAVVISIATSIGASLLLSPASPMSRSLLSLPLASLIISVRQASFSRVVLIVAC